MNGGPSQLDTFDPKPASSNGRGVTAIATAQTGLEISDALPHMATAMSDLSVLRCLTSTEGEHLRAQYFLRTGYKFVPGLPRPSAGSVVSHQSAPLDFPRYVTIGSAGYGPAYLGPDHAPFSIEDPNEARELLLRIRRQTDRIELLQELGQPFEREHPSVAVDRRSAMLTRIERLVTTPFVDALRLDRETPAVQARYGATDFGRACLLARRLFETGVSFVEIQHGGWDTHANNRSGVRTLCGQIDQPWSALMGELKGSGLLAETVVVWMGEFGRTPTINANRGRDHFPKVTPAVLGGGGLAGGRVIGQTSASGMEIEGPSFKVADLFASIFTALGIDPRHEFETDFGSPVAATDSGTPIAELF